MKKRAGGDALRRIPFDVETDTPTMYRPFEEAVRLPCDVVPAAISLQGSCVIHHVSMDMHVKFHNNTSRRNIHQWILHDVVEATPILMSVASGEEAYARKCHFRYPRKAME